LHCKTYLPLPNVEIENVAMQNLEWRDIEKLKWRCWKLKCSLIYEAKLYEEEISKFPPRWSVVRVVDSEIKWTLISINIINKNVKIKTGNWENYKFPLDMIREVKDPIVKSIEI
jgi:cell fate regulator YaaT (PSP1 superfamily)